MTHRLLSDADLASRPAVTPAELAEACKAVVAGKTLAADDPRHGTYHAYCNLKCRCEAKAEGDDKRAQRKADAKRDARKGKS